jgi:hypothetical protein
MTAPNKKKEFISITGVKLSDLNIDTLRDINIIPSLENNTKKITATLNGEPVCFYEEGSVELPTQGSDLTNLFNHLPLDKVRRYFSQLITEPNKKGEPFLTQEQLDLFIKRAFLKDSMIAKIALNATFKESGFIISLFYNFYALSTFHIKAPQGERQKYQDLLRNNFLEYDKVKAIDSNFYNKSKRVWPLTNYNQL